MTTPGLRIAQISDLHFGRHLPAMAEALLADLAAVAPSMVAVCGDLTQTAREAEFRAARAFLDQLPAPALVVPGNHDLPGWEVWSRFTSPWRRWRHHLGTDPYRPVVLTMDGLAAVGVNTARRWGPHPDWSRGRIDARQLVAIGAEFDRAPVADLRVLIAHHPFLLTEAGLHRGLVGRAPLALRRLRRKADLLLGGHIHLGYSGVVDGLVVAQSGTAFSDRLKGEPNSYNLVEADGDRLAVTVRRWGGARFDTHDRREYTRTERQWSAL
ncbi:metallophosphoesterase [Actinoplanes sichuanensis]|uniref:Metallophosphoesterase family protein n=1 Tax=Actinoplanes sichuanensis TaxID=512349 RepID=A0ABW4ATK6_9ACTN|nr:metallophosphoesterase [Actinoplanes sichuanensis]BEL05280.1 metallophosphoesterase [Actinoplanes sichuanensis]